MHAQPQTKMRSIQERVSKVREMKKIPPLYLTALYKDLDSLEKTEQKDIAYALRAMLLAYQNNQASLAYWQKAVELNPSEEHYYNWGISCQFLGLHKQALTYFREALKLCETTHSIGVLVLLRHSLSSIFAYSECETAVRLINNLAPKHSQPFPEKVILEQFFKTADIALRFGLGVAELMSKYFSYKWVSHTEDSVIEDRYYSVHKIKCIDEQTILDIVECNSALADFIIAFEEKHHLDLSQFYVCCEVAE